MNYTTLTEQELLKEYKSALFELGRAEHEWHDAAVSYGNGCCSMVESAETWYKEALELVWALEAEMKRRGMAVENH